CLVRPMHRSPAMTSIARALPLLLVAAGCAAPAPDRPDPEPDGGGGGGGGDAGTDGAPITLERTPGHYRGPCDGSAGIALDLTHFLSLTDEAQVARVYAR